LRVNLDCGAESLRRGGFQENNAFISLRTVDWDAALVEAMQLLEVTEERSISSCELEA
jgi:hypothetical protein